MTREKITLKQIRQMNAIDITTADRIPGLRIIAKSFGVYGMNGAILTDDQGNLYKIVGRTSSLFMYSY
jgi:hypothetical protein